MIFRDLIANNVSLFVFTAQLDLTHLKKPQTTSIRSEAAVQPTLVDPNGAAAGGPLARDADVPAVNIAGQNRPPTVHATEPISHLKPDGQPKTAFDHLVLPPGHKDMVLSLIAQHFRDKESKENQQVDIVSGKGT